MSLGNLAGSTGELAVAVAGEVVGEEGVGDLGGLHRVGGVADGVAADHVVALLEVL